MRTKAQKKHLHELKRRRVRQIKSIKHQVQVAKTSIGILKKDPVKFAQALEKHNARAKKREEKKGKKGEKSN